MRRGNMPAKAETSGTTSFTYDGGATQSAVHRHLTAAEILALDDQTREDVYVPQWDSFVLIRSMTGAERDQYEASLVDYERDSRGAPIIKGVALQNLRARLISMVAMSEDGRRLFGPGDLLKLGGKNAAALDVLFQAAQRLSNLTSPAIEAAKEALGKDRSDSPGSDSAESLG
jgi:hypothetical protein